MSLTGSLFICISPLPPCTLGMSLIGYVLVLLTYLGGAVALSLGSVYRMTLIDRWLRGNKRLCLSVTVHLVAILFLLTIAFHASNLVESSFNRNVTSQANPDIKLWPLQLAVPFGMCSMALVLSANILTMVRQARRNATGVMSKNKNTIQKNDFVIFGSGFWILDLWSRF